MNRAITTHRKAPRRPVQTTLLRSFVAVARKLSFSAAAIELNLTQSAVSRQIRTFEADVGMPLFNRHTRSVELTSAGKELLRVAGASVDGLDQVVGKLRARTQRKTLSINTWASFASMWLIPKLASFRAEHPDIDIQIHTTDTIVAPQKEAWDFAIRWTATAAVPAHATRLFGERLTPVASPALIGRRLKAASAVLGYTLIDSGAPANARQSGWVTWRDWLDCNGLREREPQSWLQLSLADQGIQAAQRAQGIALARLPLVLEALTKGELIEVLPDNQTVLAQAYWLVPSTEGARSAEQQLFLEWIIEQALVTRLAIGEEPAP